MQTAFLIIISLAGMAAAFWTKQFKIAAGFLILAIAFVLTIPNIVTGFWVDILMAISIIIFALGVLVIVWQKKEKIEASEMKEKETTQEEKNESK